MRRITKLFSLILSLILITVSVPMSVYSEEVSRVETPGQITENGFEDVSLEIDFGDVQEGLEFVTSMDNINFQEDVYSTTETNTPTSQQITGLPDGIYSFEAAAHSKKFIKTASTSVIEGGTFTLTQYNTSPAIRYSQYANFKVTKISGTDRYIIRLMSNENLTLSFDGTNIVTKTIPINDSDVPIQDTFYVNKYNGGFTIKPYSSSNYLIPTSDSSGITLGSLSSSAIWYPRGYRTYIEDGVYMFANRGNLGLFMDTQHDSYLSGCHAQQYAYSSSPASSFSRGGLFRIKQDGNSGKYIIRLMTNNLLTWGTADDGYVISENISMDESEIGDEQKYYIVYDLSGFMLVPCNNYQKVISATPNSTASGNAGSPDSYLKIAMRSTATDSARWLMYKYIGSDRCGADIILPDEIESIGAIVGNTYTISHTVWYTKEDMFDFSVSAMNGALDDINIEYNSDNCTATITATNIGEISFYIFADYTVNNIPIRTMPDDIVFYVIPKEGTYYIQNSQSNLYANVINHSTDNGAIIHQLGFSTDSRFKWEIEHVEDSGGYVLLKSQLSNMYMGVDLDSSSTQTRIRQYEDVGDNTLWRFETLDNGSVKIICKATESSGKVLAAPNVLPGTGEWLTQYTYTDDQNRNDEWRFRETKYWISIVNYYDRGQVIRYGEDVVNDIYSTQILANEYFAQIFDLYICTKAPIYYATLPDICKSSVTMDNIDTMCIDINHVWTTETRTYTNEQVGQYKIIYNCYCTNRSSYIKMFSKIDSSADISILWSGHKILSYSSAGNINYNRSCSSGDLIVMLCKEADLYTLIHEMAHQFGIKDHYCEDVDGKCKFEARCDKHADPSNARPSWCIMDNDRSLPDYIPWTDISTRNIDEIFCQACMEDLLTYLNNNNLA